MGDRCGVSRNKYKYIGKELDTMYGWNMQEHEARWYDPVVGRIHIDDELDYIQRSYRVRSNGTQHFWIERRSLLGHSIKNFYRSDAELILNKAQILNKKNRACILASPAKRFHFKEKFNFLFYDKRFSLADNIKDNRCQKYKSLNNLLNILVNTHNTHT